MQLAAVVEKKNRKCRSCGKKDLKTYLEMEGVVVIVESCNPHPVGGSVFMGRSVFCTMACFNQFIKQAYTKDIKGKSQRVGYRA